MSRTRYLLGNINLLNAVLAIALIFLVNYMVPFMNKTVSYSLPAMAKHGETGSGSGKTELEKTPSPLDYALITEQNLFHPERKIPEEVKEAAPLPKPDFVLYGTLITDTAAIAYMEDKKSPVTSPGRGQRQTALKRGESMSGFTLKELSEDRVIMVRGEERMTVYLNDPQQPKTRDFAGQPPSAAQVNPSSAQTPQPQVSAPQAPTQQTAQPGQPSTAPKTPTPDQRENAKQKFLDFFKGGLKR